LSFAGVGEVKTDPHSRQREELGAYRLGRDELNLAEFPLAPIAERHLDGQKTVVFRDEVWDAERREMLPRELAISGSDRYGLPTAKDDDVLLACVQLSSMQDFRSREAHFSRYGLLKLLRWEDSTRNYRRLLTSLRRWKGVTIYSTRAFYDHAAKSWVNRDFGLLDNLYVYERETAGDGEARSWLVWNEVLFESFRSGYLKSLDWDLYCRLEDPVAKRLYRFLDKRFYREEKLALDLHELAYNKVRVSRGYNTAQVKRSLQNGIRELEALWELRPLPPEKRFIKLGRGRWQAVFERKDRRARGQKQNAEHPLAQQLIDRKVSAAVARVLVRDYASDRIEAMLELFDWYTRRGEPRGPGFLVAGIRSEEGFVFPAGFESSEQRRQRETLIKSREADEQKAKEERERNDERRAKARQQAFQAFWAKLDEEAQARFEQEALAATDRTKHEGYLRARAEGGLLHDHYRQLVLREHFARTRAARPR
jgi:Replication initiator protein A